MKEIQWRTLSPLILWKKVSAQTTYEKYLVYEARIQNDTYRIVKYYLNGLCNLFQMHRERPEIYNWVFDENGERHSVSDKIWLYYTSNLTLTEAKNLVQKIVKAG